VTADFAQAFQIQARGTWSGEAVDRVCLPYDDRFRRRLLVTCDSGRQVLIHLPDARVLRDGDALVTQAGLIAVAAAPERLAEVSCSNADQMVRIAWHLGNRHLPTQIRGTRLRIREDHVIIEMVKRLGAGVTLLEAPFDPEGGAYGHGAVHGHEHSPGGQRHG